MLSLVAAACSDSAPVFPPRDEPDPPDTTSIAEPDYVPGQSYFGSNEYIEYIAGNLPVIFTSAHGGDLTPSAIPERTSSACGGGSIVTRTDLNTRELTLDVLEAFHERFGGYPHVVINHLHRSRLDANRDIGEAACGNLRAQVAWQEFQTFAQEAGDTVLARHGRGWFVDMHGHGHDVQRLELGYLLRGDQLDLDDATLMASNEYENRSSILTLSAEHPAGFAEILRGSHSLGALFEAEGYPAVPSPTYPGPSGDPYFTGGYNTVRHTCGENAGSRGGRPAGNLCGFQIEANYIGVRDSGVNRSDFAAAIARVTQSFLRTFWDVELEPDGG